MKPITLIKYHHSVQLAHLYEHLFIMEAKKILYSAGLYKGLDYWISGKTFEQGGVIKIEFEPYSSPAVAIGKTIQNLSLDPTDDTAMTRALSQITAEEPFVVHVGNKQRLQHEIRQLHNKSWLINEQITTINTREIRTRNSYIYLTNDEQSPPRILKTTISLDPTLSKEKPALLPLFNIFSRWLIFTPDDVIADENGYYSGAIYGNSRTVSVSGEILVSQTKTRHLNLNILFNRTKEIMMEMCEAHTLNRLAIDIQRSTEESADSLVMPDLERILIETGIYISYDELKRLATVENLFLILNNSVLTMQYKRKSFTSRFNG